MCQRSLSSFCNISPYSPHVQYNLYLLFQLPPGAPIIVDLRLLYTFLFTMFALFEQHVSYLLSLI